MPLKLVAAIDSAKHGLFLEDKATESLFFYLDPQKATSVWLYDALYEKVEKYTSLTIDYQSFIACPIKELSPLTLLLIIKTVIDQHNRFPLSFKTNQIDKKNHTIINVAAQSTDIDNLVESIGICKTLQETPPNKLGPKQFVEKAKSLFVDTPVEIEVITTENLQDKKLNLIYEVGKAGNDPCLLLLKYIVDPSNPSVALVGKGVCYDSGGLNIKTGSHMATMKFDMSGAAVSLGVLHALVKNKHKKNLTVVIPLVENFVDSVSYKADDVITSHAGLTVEITNTDAEGRLILADALSYSAKKLKASKLISIATLTGAIGIALGPKYTGCWTTHDEDWHSISAAAVAGAEYVWRMPLHNYFLKGLNSVIADIANSAKTGSAGSSRAAMFLKEFTHKLPYIHFDIATTCHLDNQNIACAPMLRTLYYYFKG